MTGLIPYLLMAIIAGSLLPTQAGINSQLNLWTRSPVLAAIISFAVGTLSLSIFALVSGVPIPAAAGLGRYPWWIWTGGFMGAFFVVSTVILAPKLGAAPMISLIIAGQMLASILLDHFGMLGYPMHPLNIWRFIGVAFIVGGVVLIKMF